MGGTTSKAVEQPATTTASILPDITKATFSGDYVQSALDKASNTINESAAQAAQAADEAARLGSKVSWLSTILKIVGGLIFLTAIGFLIYYLLFKYEVIGSFLGITKGSSSVGTGVGPDLAIRKAIVGDTDITKALQNLVKSSKLVVTLSPQSITAIPSNAKGAVSIIYQYSGCPEVTMSPPPNVGDNIVIEYDPTKCSTGNTANPTTPAGPSSFFSSSVNVPDGTTDSRVISGGTAQSHFDNYPGGYGMQWWMFIKDWNHKYGEVKNVVTRADATNTNTLNPQVTLHPTDSTLRILISVFGDSSNTASVAAPLPAGTTGKTDDVFICEVPNIPLQDWFSVSLTVFDRNVDVYINGLLVKSCFLPGVPKPAAGDITLAKDGGFSGSMCGFLTYPRMLTPTDATAFYSAGTSCKSLTTSGGDTATSALTGYNVKFGFYDRGGKKVNEWSF